MIHERTKTMITKTWRRVRETIERVRPLRENERRDGSGYVWELSLTEAGFWAKRGPRVRHFAAGEMAYAEQIGHVIPPFWQSCNAWYEAHQPKTGA